MDKKDWVTPPIEMIIKDRVLSFLVTQRDNTKLLLDQYLDTIALANVAISERMKELDANSDYELPRDTLTPHQAEALEHICSFYDKNGYSFTVNELCIAMGMSHRNSGVAVLDALITKGYIRKTHGKWRGVIPLFDHNQNIIKPRI